MSRFVVVDASLAFKWLVEEVDSEKAESLVEVWNDRGIQTIAPYFMSAEVTNILRQRVRRGEMRLEEGLRLIEKLLSSGIELYHSLDIHRRALELASELGQGAAYDAHYLALAEILDCEMWTADERFYRVASPASARLRLLTEFVAPEL